MAAARKEIAKKPVQYAGYNHLAIALSRRARETSDAMYYAQAEEALKKSMELAPADFESQKDPGVAAAGTPRIPSRAGSGQGTE